MNLPDINPGIILLVMLIGLAMMVVVPFIKGAMLYASTRILKFQVKSYWKAFFSALIGLGLHTAAQSIFFVLAMRGMASDGAAFDPTLYQTDPFAMLAVSLTGLVFGFLGGVIAETVAAYLFFKESLGRTIGGVLLGEVFFIATVIALYLAIIVIVVVFGLMFS